MICCLGGGQWNGTEIGYKGTIVEAEGWVQGRSLGRLSPLVVTAVEMPRHQTLVSRHSNPCGVALLTLSLSPAPRDAVGHLCRRVPCSVALRELLSGSLQGVLTHTPLGHHWQLFLPAPSLCTWGGNSWRVGPCLTHAQIPSTWHRAWPSSTAGSFWKDNPQMLAARPD